MNKKAHVSFRLSILVILATALAACARTPVPELLPADVPIDWIGPIQSEADIWPNVDWWNNFGSEELTRIIEQVMENNISLQTNRRNLRDAQIVLEDANVQLWPSPSLSVRTNSSTSRTQFRDGGSSSGGSTGPISLNGSAGYNNVLNMPLNHARAVNNYESTLANIYNTRLSTLAQAASTYFQLLFVRDQIRQAELNLENALTVGGFTQLRVDAGIAVPLDLLQQQNTIQNQRIQLTQLEQQEFSLRASLALLLGRRVEGFDVEGQTLEGIAVPTVQPGLPSELLRRRPDLFQAEMNLRNAAISVDTARLSFFPSISLSGNASASSPALLGVIADPAQTTVSLTASVAQTLLTNGGRGRNLERARLTLENSLGQYRQTVLSAFNDIEVQLNNIQITAQQGELVRRQLEAAEESYRIAQLRYEQGVLNFEQLNSSQLNLFSARNSVLSNDLNQINNILSFYQALGGGWDYEQIEILASAD